MSTQNLFSGKAALWKKWESRLYGPRRPAHEKISALIGELQALRVLDFATGIGEPARTIAQLNPDTRIVGVDISEEMIAIAQQRTATLGLKNLEFRQVSLKNPDLSVGSDHPEVITSVFGIEYTELTATLDLVRGALQSRGHLVFLTWGPVSRNPLHEILTKPLGLFPDSPIVSKFPLFSLSDQYHVLQSALAKSFSVRSTEKIVGEFHWESVAEFYQMKREISPPVSNYLSYLKPQDESTFVSCLTDELSQFKTKQGYAIPFELNFFHFQKTD